jgi:hypothetical protein
VKLAALLLQGPAGMTHEFTPDGDSWELEIHGARGGGPGGRWTSNEVAEHVATSIFETVEPRMEAAA